MAQEMIAVLDGFAGPRFNVNASGQYAGGSTWYPGAPTLNSGEWGLAGAGRALADAGAPQADAGGLVPPAGGPITPPRADSMSYGGGSVAQGGQNMPNDPYQQGGIEGDWMNDPSPEDRAEADYRGYLAAFAASPFVATSEGMPAALRLNVNASGQYAGGSTWYPGAPTLNSGEWGLAGAQDRRFNPNPPGQSAGGSSWYPGAPTLVSGEWGLSQLRLRGAMLGALAASGGDMVRAVRAARVAVQQVPIGLAPGRTVYESAFRAAQAAGYDRQWAHSAASRIAQTAEEIGYDRFATKA